MARLPPPIKPRPASAVLLLLPLLLAAPAALAAALAAAPAAAPPATARAAVTDTYHGVAVVDDYRAMEPARGR